MSPLDELDVDRISDKVKLVVREEIDKAMEAHAAEHRSIWKKLDGLNNRVLLASGGAVVAVWVLERMLTAANP